MANYPGSDPSFPDRSAGQTIASAHMDAVQDEVTAIGSALRGTLQHDVTLAANKSLNVGGNSTLAALSAGASTLATVSVTGGSTFAGDVQANSTVTFASVIKMPWASTTLSGGSTRFDNVVLPSSGVFIRVDNNSTAIAISGFSATGSSGRVICVVNPSLSAQITLLHADANSSADSRIVCAQSTNAVVAGPGALWLGYDPVSGSWRGIAPIT